MLYYTVPPKIYPQNHYNFTVPYFLTANPEEIVILFSDYLRHLLIYVILCLRNSYG